jgi:hypothetical protein
MSLSKFSRDDNYGAGARMCNLSHPRRFQHNEVTTSNKLIYALYKNEYTILLAQPQSGKTNTYHLAAAELIRQGKFRRAIIISGNSETELKEQLTGDKRTEFFTKYRHYLRDNEGLSEDEIDDAVSHVKKNLQVLYGAELNKAICDEQCTDILIIWDESHHAQGIINRPNKYLERMGIPPNGIFNDIASERNIGFISVSATPFSELCANNNEVQHKKIIRMKPGDGYKGVKDYLDRDLVKGLGKDWLKQLPSILKLHKSTVKPQWAFIRTRDSMKKNQNEEIKRISAENGWRCEEYNSTSKYIKSLDELRYAPKEDTIILLKDMCRMGKSIIKTHISFVMETALDPNTDTTAQGLMGRAFGYDNDHDIYVYVSNKVLKKDHAAGSSELEKYVQLMEGDEEDGENDSVSIIPSRALNVLPSSKHETLCDNYPIVIPGFIEDRDDPDYSEFSNERITRYVKTAITYGDLQNKNSVFHFDEIKRQVNDPTTRIVIHKVEKRSKETNETYIKVPTLLAGILSDNEEKNAVRSLPGCGLNSLEHAQVNVWTFTSNNYNRLGFPAGTLVIQSGYKKTLDGIPINIPKTTGKEAFTSKREDETEIIGNGTYSTTLSPETCTSIDVMKKSITELVKISLEPRVAVTMPRCITSNQVASGEWQGILVNEAVYAALQKGGIIFNHIKTTSNLKIKTVCQRGPSTKACKESGLKRLCKIEW